MQDTIQPNDLGFEVQSVYVDHANQVIIKRDNGVTIEVSGFDNESLAQAFADYGDFNELNNRFCTLYGINLTFSFS